MLKLRPNRPKKPLKERPPTETNSNDSLFTFSFPAPGEKKGYPQSSPKNENQNQNQNQKPAKKTTKLMPITASIPSIHFPLFFLEQHLQKALKSLTSPFF